MPSCRTPAACRRSAVARRSGFTLVELLVVIAMIGILVALLLPAVQAARAAARRTACSHNLTQISIATQSYEILHQVLPAGTVESRDPVSNRASGYHMSWIVQLLPHLDEGNAFRKIDFSKGVYDPANSRVRAHSIALLNCPSSAHPGNPLAPESCYAGVHHDVEAPVSSSNQGCFVLNRFLRYDEITDGAAHTLLFGEKIVQSNDLGWMSGTNATLRNMGEPLNVTGFKGKVPTFTTSLSPTDPLHVGGFGSVHVGVVLFAFADGSVRPIKEVMPHDTLRKLAHRADGELLEISY